MNVVDDSNEQSMEARVASRSGQITAQVNYVYEDNAIPSERLREPFVEKMKSRYHFSVIPTESDRRMQLIRELESMSISDRSAITKLKTLTFERGTYRVRDGSAYAIQDMSLSHDRIYCMLEGPTCVAETIVEAVGELVAEVSGVPWNTIGAQLLYVHYGTASSVRLGVPGIQLLSKEMQHFARQVLGHPRVASSMNPRLIGAPSVPMERYNVVVHPYDFQFKVRVVNMNTNDTDAHDVRLSIRKIADHDAGLYLVQTALPSDLHEEVVGTLRKMITEGSP